MLHHGDSMVAEEKGLEALLTFVIECTKNQLFIIPRHSIYKTTILKTACERGFLGMSMKYVWPSKTQRQELTVRL